MKKYFSQSLANNNKISRVHNPHIAALGPPIPFFLLSMEMNTFSWTQVYHVICCRLMRTTSLVNELFWQIKCRRKCCIELTHALQCAKAKQIFRYEHAVLYLYLHLDIYTKHCWLSMSIVHVHNGNITKYICFRWTLKTFIDQCSLNGIYNLFWF